MRGRTPASPDRLFVTGVLDLMARDGLGYALFALHTSVKPLILDLSKVTFADDASIRILVKAYASLSETHSVALHFALDGQGWLSKQFTQARR